MKNKMFVIIMFIVMLFIFASCSNNAEMDYTSDYGSVESQESPQVIMNQTNRKIVYTVNVSMYCEDFNKALEGIYTAVNKNIEAYNWISNSNINNNSNYKSASLTVRVKTSELNDFLADLPALGKITNQSQNAEDITYNYSTIEAKISALETQKEYYEGLIEKPEIQANESLFSNYSNKLVDINEEYDLLTVQLTQYDNELEYSTVNINISSNEEEAVVSVPFGKKIKQIFIASVTFLWKAIKWIFLALVAIFPYALIAGIIVFLVFFIKKKTKIRKQGKSDSKKSRKEIIEKKSIENEKNE